MGAASWLNKVMCSILGPEGDNGIEAEGHELGPGKPQVTSLSLVQAVIMRLRGHLSRC